MAADCAEELRKHNVAMISLWPGPVKTEYVEKNVNVNCKYLGITKKTCLEWDIEETGVKAVLLA